MNISFFGSSLVSAYWNGAATYYRGMIRCLHERGHQVTFYEPDAYDRQKHRDLADPPWAKSVVYANDESAVRAALAAARGSDVIVKTSGVGVFDELLEAAVLELGGIVLFWDVDAPATLERMRGNESDAFRACVPRYDAVFTYGGGQPVVNAYRSFGARRCEPIHNALDPTTHFPVPHEQRFGCDLAFLGNRLPDREERVEEFFWKPARLLPERRFLLGGNGWDDYPRPANVEYLGHVYTADHNALNSTPLSVLNVSRQSMADYGFSPATRVFEAAGAAGCLITDAWEGIELFLQPDKEVLVAHSGEDVARHVRALDAPRARAIGEAARQRVVRDHTYERRSGEVEALLLQLQSARTP